MRRREERVARAVVRAEVDHGRAELVGDPDRPAGWTLLVDGTAQSHVDLDDPTHLEFEYVRRLGHLVDLLAPAGRPLRALHLGGGAWTLPRYLATTRPGSPQRVVEIDAALVDLVSSRLPADGLGIDVVVGDHTDFAYTGIHDGVLAVENRSKGATYSQGQNRKTPRNASADRPDRTNQRATLRSARFSSRVPGIGNAEVLCWMSTSSRLAAR